MKQSTTKAEKKQIQDLIKEAARLDKEMANIHKSVCRILGTSVDDDWVFDAVYNTNSLSLNDLLTRFSIKVKG